MKFTILALPVLATAAVVQRQAARDVQVVGAKTLSVGNGCPAGHFNVAKNPGNNTLSLILDVYYGALDFSDRSNQREAECVYEVTLRFPTGCTSGTVAVIPHGTISLDDGMEGKFMSSYVFSPSTPNDVVKQPADIIYTSANYGAPPGTWKDWVHEHLVNVKVNAQNGQNDYTFTARSRAFLTAASKTPDEGGLFQIDAIDIGVRNMVSC